ncbi:hypothetical protein KGQ24_02590 [Patescibacteria group bacterium]|nr:hypothetical protein [Patescibacteria group bacterium]
MSDTTDYLKNYITTLNNPDNLELLKGYYQGVTDQLSYDEHLDFATFLANFLVKEGPIMEKQDPKMYGEYQLMWYSCVFSAFPALSADDQRNILSQRILAASFLDADVDQIMLSYFNHGYSLQDASTIGRTLANDLEQNNETLGTNPITVQGRRYLPAVKYWIMDYANFPSQSGRRGSIDRLNYINKSQNLRPLTQTQKQTLLKILKLYDSFLNPEPPPLTGEQAVLANLGRGAAIAARPSSFRPSVQPRPTPQPVQVGGIQQRRPAAGVPITGRPTAPFIGSRPAVDIDSKLKELRNRKNNAS